MRRRWIALLGRVGMVLLVIGLALLLVSLIPPAPSGFSGGSGFSLGPEKYQIHGYPFSGVYSPQSGLQLSVESNNSINFYLLDVNNLQLEEGILNWVRESFPDLNETEIWQGRYNTSVLEAYLQSYPESILLEKTVEGEWSGNFFPTKVVNVTPVFSNPSLNRVEVDIEMKGIMALASRERVLTPAQWLIPIGILLALPRGYMRIKKTPMR